MEYFAWRKDVFGQKPGSDPVMLDLQPETSALSMDDTLDHVGRALSDPEIHDTYSRDQIGIGLQLIYSNACSNICFCYLEAGDEARRVQGIRNLVRLYQNYFARYCLAPVADIRNDHLDGDVAYLCYMLWDIFVLYPGNASEAMIAAGLDVMATGIQMNNDHCIVSAIHGLGHWATHNSRALQILRQWLCKPTTQNAEVLHYAQQATTSCIL